MIDEDAPTRVAITGVAGYLGRELAALLDIDSSIDSVVGIDVADYTVPSPKTRFFKRSVEQPFEDLFLEQRVNAAVHLAFTTEPAHDRAQEERVNIEGTRHFLDACAKAKVKTVLVASSALAYGARADNPEVLYEGAPLRASPGLPCAHDKIRVEELCYEFVKKNPDVALQIVRPCLVVGPHMNNVLSRMIDRRVILAPRGANPPLQFIHEDDVVRALARLLRSRKVGVFNLAADGAITLRKIAELAGRPVLRLPRFLLRWLVALGWSLGWRRIAAAPDGYLDYITHPWVISNIKIKTELFFLFKFDASRAIRDYLDRDLNSAERTALHRAADDVAMDDIDELDEIHTPEPPIETTTTPTTATTPDGEDEATPRLPTTPPPPILGTPATPDAPKITAPLEVTASPPSASSTPVETPTTPPTAAAAPSPTTSSDTPSEPATSTTPPPTSPTSPTTLSNIALEPATSPSTPTPVAASTASATPPPEPAATASDKPPA